VVVLVVDAMEHLIVNVSEEEEEEEEEEEGQSEDLRGALFSAPFSIEMLEPDS
jgi:hypothetical protein